MLTLRGAKFHFAGSAVGPELLEKYYPKAPSSSTVCTLDLHALVYKLLSISCTKAMCRMTYRTLFKSR